MRIHFIAIGGSAMHNLAIALKENGHAVSGSDDEVFEPSRSRLARHGLLPAAEGWHPEVITPELDAIILGMHARPDNPELLRAQELGLKIYSYPEYLYEQSKDKKRVVIAGSHGKTTITAMVLHVLQYWKHPVDFMVGAQLPGFDTMVQLTEEADCIVLEGDEYLSSPIDRRPKFLWYQPDVALISGIAWDHINVFPTEADYVEQFRLFLETVDPEGTVIYCALDPRVKRLVEDFKARFSKVPYATPAHRIQEGTTWLKATHEEIPLQVFGDHNLQNLNGALQVCRALDIHEEQFYEAIRSFSGAARRLEKIAENAVTTVYKDFAHAPSKLKATTTAVKAQFPERELVAVIELHTFSSLNAEFLQTYQGAMQSADKAIVYYNPHTIAHKRLEPITPEQVREAFGREDLMVRTDSEQLQHYLKGLDWKNKVLLLMTSGNLDGVDLDAFAGELVSEPA